jgi:hypothetical protein
MADEPKTSTTPTSTTATLPELKGWLGRGVDLFEFNPLCEDAKRQDAEDPAGSPPKG